MESNYIIPKVMDERVKALIISGDTLSEKNLLKHRLPYNEIKRIFGSAKNFYDYYDLRRPKSRDNPYTENLSMESQSMFMITTLSKFIDKY